MIALPKGNAKKVSEGVMADLNKVQFISEKLKDVAGEAYAMSSGEIDLINSPLFNNAVLQDEGLIFEKMKILMDSMLLEKYKSISFLSCRLLCL